MEEVSAILVGCGSVSQAWIGATKACQGIDLVAVVDPDEQRQKWAADLIDLDRSRCFETIEEALEQCKPQVVYLCTPPHLHVPQGRLALQAGAHVLSEKPAAESWESALKALEAQRASGQVWAVMQNRRFLPAMAAIRDLLADGRIGEPHTFNVDFYLGPRFGGFREEMEHVLLLDMAIHTFDQFRALTDRDPVDVFARSFNPVGSWYQHGASAQATFGLAGGGVYSYRGSWCAEGEGLATSWEGSWRIQGSKGQLTWAGGLEIQIATGKEDAAETMAVADWPGERTGHNGWLAATVAALREGRAVPTPLEDNLKSLAMVVGAVRSAEEGQLVPIEAVPGR
jgi:predicted dehydrogenase